MNELQKMFEEHSKNDQEAFRGIKEELKIIRENHLTHIQADMDTVKNDVSWLKSFFWIVVGIVITGMATLFK